MGNKSSSPAKVAAATGVGESSKADRQPATGPRPIPKNFTLLDGCTTLEEHEETIRCAQSITANYHRGSSSSSSGGVDGEEKLRALGFEFRFVPCCPAHAPDVDVDNGAECASATDEKATTTAASDAAAAAISPPRSPGKEDDAPDTTSSTTDSSPTTSSTKLMHSASVVSLFSNTSDFNERFAHDCHSCATRLFYVGGKSLKSLLLPSDSYSVLAEDNCQENSKLENEQTDATLKEDEQPFSASEEKDSPVLDEHTEISMITPENRQRFIADGAMYELMANLAQEAAQSKMCTAFDLEWITVCDEHHLGEKVRAMVDKDHRLLLEEGENNWVVHEILSGCSGCGGKEEKKEDDPSNVGGTDQSAETSQSSQTQQTPQESPQVSINKTKTTLLIATGRGKVRAGIFSRQHLLTAGIEVGTSWHCIREARMRKWGVAIVDPNARGEEKGYESFRRSVSQLFLGGEDFKEISRSSTDATTETNGKVSTAQSTSKAKDSVTSTTSDNQSSSTASQPTPKQPQHSIYILAHSASGGQLVRHLREDPTLLPSIRAIAFTDSTHNVQWCKHDPHLQDFLQKGNCVYLRSNDVRSSQSCVKVSSRGKDIWCDCSVCINNKKATGMEADTDHFWRHRFGSVKTLWAGTADHALSNWAGHESIWDHFDSHHVGTKEGTGNNEDGTVADRVVL